MGAAFQAGQAKAFRARGAGRGQGGIPGDLVRVRGHRVLAVPTPGPGPRLRFLEVARQLRRTGIHGRNERFDLGPKTSSSRTSPTSRPPPWASTD